MTRNEFKAIAGFLTAGCGFQFTIESLEVWFDLLVDVPTDAVQYGAKRFLAEDGQFVSIAKIRKLAAEFGGRGDDASEACETMFAAVRRYGYDQQEKAKAELSPRTWQTIRAIGGWRAVCESPTADRSTFRAQFRNAYEQIAHRAQQAKTLPTELIPKRIDAPSKQLIEAALGIGNMPTEKSNPSSPSKTNVMATTQAAGQSCAQSGHRKSLTSSVDT